MAKFVGKWKLESSSNFEDYMKAVGKLFTWYSLFVPWHNMLLKGVAVDVVNAEQMFPNFLKRCTHVAFTFTRALNNRVTFLRMRESAIVIS